MGYDIPLGRIAGIKTGMHVTVLLVAALYTFVLAVNVFPNQQPGLNSGAYWVAGIMGAFFFFLSLLIHEIGHALVARDEGIGVRSMGLTLLGGVTRMESSPTTAGAELRVSIVGPVASATCGLVFLIGAFLMPDEGSNGLIGAVFAWVGLINLLLAAFNMIPAAPLDGGKVLSAIIWWRTGNQSTALTWSSVVGIVFGMAMITWGVREARADDGSSYAVLTLALGAFIGWSAFQQLRAAPLYRSLDGLTVATAMAASPPTAPAWITVGEFLRTTAPDPEHQSFPVVGPDGQVSGLLTAAAIRASLPQTWEQLPVTQLAFPLDRLSLVRPDEPLLPALQKLDGAEVRHALVVDADGRIVGTLDPSALHRAMALSKAGIEPVAAGALPGRG